MPQKPRAVDAARIPIVLGVVGHRNLRKKDEADLWAALDAIFREFDDAYPDSPKVLLSPLAPGADQLAADAALFMMGPDGKTKVPRLGWSVRAAGVHTEAVRTEYLLSASALDT